MKKVYGRDVLEMLAKGFVVVLEGWEYPEEDMYPMVMYQCRDTRFVGESFPIVTPTVSACNYFDAVTLWGSIEECPVSTLETSSDYIDVCTKYTVFSKEDIEAWKEKLEYILEGYA